MRVLIVTQVVDRNDPVLGFFHRWIEEFAKHADKVTVICLKKGEYELPKNVVVYSLGKERGRAYSAIYGARFLGRLYRLRREYDSVFIHMNPEYALLGGLFWRAMRTRTVLWYAHKKVDLKLRIAVSLVDAVCSVSLESFRLQTEKLHIVGHGIEAQGSRNVLPVHTGPLRLVTVGRISESKGLMDIIDALSLVPKEGPAWKLSIIGGVVTVRDGEHLSALKAKIASLGLEDQVQFLGPQKHAVVLNTLQHYDLFLHASTGTGSIDKAVLESCVSRVPVVSSSEAFKELLGAYGLWASDACEMARIISLWSSREDSEHVKESLSRYVQEHHGLSSLISNIVTLLTPKKQSVLITLLRRIALWVRDILDVLLRFEEHSILVYHAVSGVTPNGTGLAPETLERHLRMLVVSGYVFIPLSLTVAWRDGQIQIPRKTVSITFDDGYTDFETIALPILERLQVPATLFFVGDGGAYRNRVGKPHELISLERLKELQRHPLIELGYHSRSHPDLRTLRDEDELRDECESPFPTKFFAYPGGNYLPRVLDCLKSLGYTHAFSIKRKLVTKDSHVLAMPRTVITGDMRDWQVRASASSVQNWVYWARKAFDTWKK